MPNNEQNKDEIFKKVSLVKEWLNYVSGRFCSIEKYDQTIKIQNLNNYPLDFQIFMEEIGPIQIGIPDSYLIILICQPEPWHLSDIAVFDIPDAGEEVEPGVIAKDVFIFGRNVDSNLYGYIFNNGKYTFWSQDGDYPNFSFLDFFIAHIELYLDYQYGHKLNKNELFFEPFVSMSV